MMSTVLKSKIHGATVTDSQLEYEGSLTIDQALMDKVGIVPYEKILIANLRNGERFETYAIPAAAGSAEICLNGATAHKGSVGDRLIIFAFAVLREDELADHQPAVVHPDAQNRLPA